MENLLSVGWELLKLTCAPIWTLYVHPLWRYERQHKI